MRSCDRVAKWRVIFRSCALVAKTQPGVYDVIASGENMNKTHDTLDSNGTLRQRVSDVVELIRPAVQADGGDLELVDVTDAGVVKIRFHGACVGCPSANMTLQMGIERNLRQRVPEVTSVVAVG